MNSQIEITIQARDNKEVTLLHRRSLSFLSLALLLTRCASPASLNSPGEKSATLPPTAANSSQEVIAIVGTNDIHGALFAQKLKTRDDEAADYEAAGLATLATYLKILKKELGSRMLWLDGGDEFQGSLESNLGHGMPVVDFFNSEGLNAAAIGNHEFDWGVPILEDRFRQASYPYLAANIYKKGIKPPERAQFPNVFPSKIFKVGRVMVGVIGLSTLDTPRTTRPENVAELDFDSLAQNTIREAQSLRQRGAQIVAITSHVGLKCARGKVASGYRIRSIEDSASSCDEQDEMVRLLKELPIGTVDAVVAGHSHSIVHHWVAGVPVIQGAAYGRYFNVIYLTYDLSKNKLLTDATRIEGPVPVCSKIFRHQRDCAGDVPPPREGRGSLVVPVFHGQKIAPDPSVESLLEPAAEKAREMKDQRLGNARQVLEHVRTKESMLGNLIADSMREATHADVAIINGGGIRSSIEQGPITFGAVFKVMPFDNAIVLIDVKGSELRKILQVAESGSRSFASVSGLQLKLMDDLHDAKGKDLNHDGRTDPWEYDMLLDVRTADGKPLSDKKTYRVATVDFLTSGGDDWAWPMSQIPKERFHFEGMPLVRDVFVDFVKAHPELPSGQFPGIDAAKPRFQFVKAAKKAKRRSARGKKHRRGATNTGFDQVFR